MHLFQATLFLSLKRHIVFHKTSVLLHPSPSCLVSRVLRNIWWTMFLSSAVGAIFSKEAVLNSILRSLFTKHTKKESFLDSKSKKKPNPQIFVLALKILTCLFPFFLSQLKSVISQSHRFKQKSGFQHWLHQHKSKAEVHWYLTSVMRIFYTHTSISTRCSFRKLKYSPQSTKNCIKWETLQKK